jgi:hypothetical protein
MNPWRRAHPPGGRGGEATPHPRRFNHPCHGQRLGWDTGWPPQGAWSIGSSHNGGGSLRSAARTPACCHSRSRRQDAVEQVASPAPWATRTRPCRTRLRYGEIRGSDSGSRTRGHVSRFAWSYNLNMAWPRLSRRAALVVVLIGAGAAAACGGSSSDVRAGEIVFTRSIGEWPKRYDLYVVAPDGGRARLLVRDASEAAVSPDGRQVAFLRDRAIWLMGRDGRHQRPLTKPKHGRRPSTGVEDMTPAWAPDGEHVYFERLVWKTYSSSIYRVDVGGKGLRRLTAAAPSDHGHCQGRPAPSPDGRIVVFDETLDCQHGTDSFLAAITTAGRRTKLQFQFPAISSYEPAWAPDGRRLACAALDIDAAINGKRGASGIYVSSLRRSAPRRIPLPAVATQTDSVDSPAWSQDGKWIAPLARSRAERLSGRRLARTHRRHRPAAAHPHERRRSGSDVASDVTVAIAI